MKQSNTFTIYNASAGSGKTYTLVKEYLLLLLKSPKNDSYKNILAITFTNKAVAEMKSRIVAGLHALAQKDPSEADKKFKKDIALSAGMSVDVVQEKSSNILKNIIHNYAAFEVSTIDGFTHRVLRTFAKDLGLPLNFEVELRTDDVLNEAVDRLISKAGRDKEITRVLVNFVLSKTDEDKSWDIARDLFAIAKLLTQEVSRDFLDMLKKNELSDFENLRKEVRLQQEKLQNELQALAADFFSLIENNGIESGDFKGGYCPKFFLKLQKGDFNPPLSAVWQQDLSEKALYANKLASDKKQILDTLQPRVVEYFSVAKRGITSLQFLEAVEKNLVPLSLLSAIQDQIEEIKKENSIVLISEFNATIGKAVKDQPAPFIYERLGDRYRHYFIDEFQDTSQLQWENLVPLVNNTLSEEHPGGEHGSLTLVGDAKQSIYRWRGGKAEQFMELCQKRHPFSIEKSEVIVLPNNYRSARNIVNFNNEFFKFASDRFLDESHRDLFLKSGQGVISEKGGYVNISFIEAENASEEMEVYPSRVLEIINSLKEKERPLADVCILTRTRRESIAVANFLSENEVPVISAESLLVNRSPKVAFINAVLQYCLDTADKTLKYEILDYLLAERVQIENEFNFLEQQLDLEGQEFFEPLKEHGMEFSLETAISLSVYEAAEYIIRSFNLQSASDAYLQFYLDFVYEIANSEGAGIFEFLEVWERKKEELSIVVPQGEDAVQIMTIHKAKGLEFPVVIYPFANGKLTDTARESFWLHLPEEWNSNVSVAYLGAAEKMKEWDGQAPEIYHELCCNSQLDALNVLYVAMTRPEQQLYVISKLELDKKGNENSNRFSGLLISYLRSIGRWDGSTSYEFGDIDEWKPADVENRISLQQEHFFSSPTQRNGISIITRSGLMWNSRQQEAIEKGQLIHDLFAEINTGADVERVLENGKNEGRFSREAESSIKNAVNEVITHPELREYFVAGAVNINERDIITENGLLLRPDRLNFNGNKATIIDYKTGAVNPAHKNQIIEYGEVLEGMDYEVDKRILVYINEEISICVV
ncbi:UvrD-helicase domain-containing protein [Salinimicrobium oceani]|uniref:DNA 3'-5' helicase n=1 Tax=Salinimicrobium oceani TaxID=2722702 RepID=A0ABX1D012_9FLAO|nr:UvrD-helicase domain-containing protein [Salinimicrobium oceani]NJW53853.1 UvrD-helicase domain-containing protein [Salinimicrobium oceani]